jgi:hypothetical protein
MAGLFSAAQVIDARLLATPRWLQRTFIALTVALIAGFGVAEVPRPAVNFAGLPLLGRIQQAPEFGTDTISDMYESKVVLHDVRDMYTKRGVDETPLEARTWSKEATGPYPPTGLLIMAAFYAAGAWTGIGLYGFITILAVAFILGSAVYSLRTRWYVFPLVWSNVVYLTHRFFSVQDDSYLILLVAVLAALFLARAGRRGAHALMAVAIAIKLSPMYYLKEIPRMPRVSAALVIAIVCAGLLLPYVIWPNYAYIYRFQEERHGHYWTNTLVAGCFVAVFTVVLAYVESREPFDLEDRIGWSLVPLAMLLALTMNAARHLLLVLLVPDKRVARNLAGAAALWLEYPLAAHVPFGAVVYFCSVFLWLALVWYLRRIGWATIRDDLRHPARTVRMMIGVRTLTPTASC